MNHIELFAGCGGLSLGLKSINSKLLLANELSPMASETFALNFFNEDLRALARKPSKENFTRPLKTKWLSSRFDENSLVSRLSENPQEYPPVDKGICDLSADGVGLEGSLVVGSITELNKWFSDGRNKKSLEQLRRGFGDGQVDLISGGPPCQSFSLAGLRRKDCEKNSLPWEFAKFVRVIQPRFVLLENVTGILRAFKDDQGNEYYAWFELAKAFAAIGYVPLCLHVNAKFAGVPQNRPRFILLGVQHDFFEQISPTFNEAEGELFAQPHDFFLRSKLSDDRDLRRLAYRDISRPADFELFRESFLAPLVSSGSRFVSVKEAIDDLKGTPTSPGAYPINLSKTFESALSSRPMSNHVWRNSNPLVKSRFRIYQVIKSMESETQKRVIAILQGKNIGLTEDDWRRLSNEEFILGDDKFHRFQTKNELEEFLRRHPTKKQTQKALLADQPAPAALSIPDDACHYDRDYPRTLTVREMARIQSFPDEFQFCSKATTGGINRRFEVPQYTQVGNAVPPLLGRALGFAIEDLLSRTEKLKVAVKEQEIKV